MSIITITPNYPCNTSNPPQQPHCHLHTGTAVTTVLVSAIRALRTFAKLLLLHLFNNSLHIRTHIYIEHDVEVHASGGTHPLTDAAVTLDHRQALAIPIFSSIALLTMFYLFSAIQFLMLFIICFAAATGMVFAAQPLLDAWALRRPWVRRRVTVGVRSTALFNGRAHVIVPLGEAILGCISGLSVITWMITGSMVLNNVLGISLCIAFISFVRLPSLKVTSLLLTALFFYDIFWVFFSEGIFGKNVMVEAATKQAVNPALTVASALHLPTSGFAEKLDLPVKLVFPANLFDWWGGGGGGHQQQGFLLLGLGDVALPGMLIALLLSEDMHAHKLRSSSSGTASSTGMASMYKALMSWQFWRHSYVLSSWIGYAVGMFLALGLGTIFQTAQPALLYLVPSTLGPAVVKAQRRRELWALWEGTGGGRSDEWV